MAQPVDFYAILDVAPTATKGEVLEAVRRQRILWIHRRNSPDAQRRAEAKTRMRQIDDAEQTLLDPLGRQRYDSSRGSTTVDAAESSPPPPEADDAEEWVRRAEEYLAAGDAQRARLAAREATSADQNDSTAWRVRARASFMLGNHYQAEFELCEAARHDPDDVDGLLDLVDAQGQLERFDDAYATLRKVDGLRPDDVHVEVSWGLVDLLARRPDDAVARLAALHQKHPNNRYVSGMYAAALHDAVLSRLTVVEPGGTYKFTSPAQVDFAKQNLPLAEPLRYDDAELRSSIHWLEVHGFLAEQRRFVRHTRLTPYVVAMTLVLLLAWRSELPGLIQWILLLGVPVVYAVRNRLPGWRAEKLAVEAGEGDVVRWGI